MNSDIQMIPLFSYPLMKTKINQVSENEVGFIKNLTRVRNGANNGYHSIDINILVNCVELSSLRSQIEEKFHHYVYNMLQVDNKTKFSMVGSFINFHSPGDCAHLHKHTNSLFSCVLYLNVPQNSGGIFFNHSGFHSPISNEIKLEFNEKNMFNTSSLRIVPDDLDLLFFPSTCYHSVEKNNSEYMRVSLVASFFPCSILSNGDTVLNLTSIRM